MFLTLTLAIRQCSFTVYWGKNLFHLCDAMEQIVLTKKSTKSSNISKVQSCRLANHQILKKKTYLKEKTNVNGEIITQRTCCKHAL